MRAKFTIVTDLGENQGQLVDCSEYGRDVVVERDPDVAFKLTTNGVAPRFGRFVPASAGRELRII